MRTDKKWEDELRDDEVVIDDNGRRVAVKLKGLERLAHEAGWTGGHVYFPPPIGEGRLVQCVYTAFFSDKTSWPGAADVNGKNTNEPFSQYPTSTAESRAKARALRTALQISLVSAEEIRNIGDLMSDKADSQQIRAITKLLETKNIDLMTLFKEVLSPTRQKNVVELKELTSTEASTAMAFLNQNKASKKTSRDSRKAELERRIQNEE